MYCTVCKRLNSRAYAYPGHSDLPPLRFDDRHAFASTGCDYLGPFYTCAASRAVILDVVNSSNTQNVIQSFRRGKKISYLKYT